MAAKEAPFATDLQPKFDVKIVGGKVIPVQVYSRSEKSKETFASRNDERRIGEQLQMLSLAKDNIRKEMQSPSSRNSPTRKKQRGHERGYHGRSLTHPPPVTASSVLHGNRDPLNWHAGARTGGNYTNLPHDVLHRVSKQIRQVRYWTNNLEDLARSCGRLDHLRTGCLSFSDLHRALESYGFLISRDDLEVLVSASRTGLAQSTSDCVQSDSPSVQYGALCAFLHQIASVDPNSSTARMQNIPPYTSRNISSNNTPEPSHFVGQIRRERAHLQTCPSRLVITKTVKRNPSLTPLRPPGGFGTRELSEAEKGILSRETARLLVKIEYVLREHNWGNSVQMKRFEQALASKDRERTGYLDVDEVRETCLDVGLPLSDELLLDLISKCFPNTATNLVRWIAFLDLLFKACPISAQQLISVSKKTYPVLSAIQSSQTDPKSPVPPGDHHGHKSTVPPGDHHGHKSTVPPDDHHGHKSPVPPGDHHGHKSTVPPDDHHGHKSTVPSDDHHGHKGHTHSPTVDTAQEEDVLMLIDRALLSCSDRKGFIERDEAYRIVKNYSAVYPNSVNVDVLMFRNFCDECTVFDKGRPLVHTDDVMEYLINFN